MKQNIHTAVYFAEVTKLKDWSFDVQKSSFKK